MTIYEFIDEQCRLKKISRGKLADLAGIPRSSLNMAFKRKTEISIERLIKIAEVLKIHKSDFAQFRPDFDLLVTQTGIQQFREIKGLSENAIKAIQANILYLGDLEWFIEQPAFWDMIRFDWLHFDAEKLWEYENGIPNFSTDTLKEHEKLEWFIVATKLYTIASEHFHRKIKAELDADEELRKEFINEDYDTDE